MNAPRQVRTGRGRQTTAAPNLGEAVRVAIGNLHDPILTIGSPELLPALESVAMGWTMRSTPVPSPEAVKNPLAVALKTADGFTLHSRHLEAPLAGLPLASVVCGLVADLAQAFADAHPEGLALHCGAFRRDGRVVAIAGPACAGKSTLISRMAAETDCEIVCDDVLPVSPDGEAFALGFCPRLRLPLPDEAAPAFRTLVASRLALSDDRYGYIRPERLVPHGTAGPLSCLILLDRRRDAPACLHEVGTVEAVREIVLRNINPALDPDTTLDRAESLLGRIAVCRLVYSDLEEAVALLARAYPADAKWPAVPPDPTLPDASPERTGAPPLALDVTVVQRSNVFARTVGDAVFLSTPEDQEVHELNPVGAAAWRYLSEPATGAEIAQALALAFPEADTEAVAEDIAGLLGALVDAGLVEHAPQESFPPRRDA